MCIKDNGHTVYTPQSSSTCTDHSYLHTVDLQKSWHNLKREINTGFSTLYTVDMKAASLVTSRENSEYFQSFPLCNTILAILCKYFPSFPLCRGRPLNAGRNTNVNTTWMWVRSLFWFSLILRFSLFFAFWSCKAEIQTKTKTFPVADFFFAKNFERRKLRIYIKDTKCHDSVMMTGTRMSVSSGIWIYHWQNEKIERCWGHIAVSLFGFRHSGLHVYWN